MKPGFSKEPGEFHVKKKKKETNKNKRYNKDYNLYFVRNTSTSRLLESIQEQRLSDCLEVLSKLGFGDEEALVTLADVQLVAGLGDVAV